MRAKHNPFLLNIVRACVLLSLFAPLLVWNDLFYAYDSTKSFFLMAVIELCVLSYLWLAALHPPWRPRLDTVGKALLSFLCVLIIASLVGVDPSFSFWSSIDHVTGLIMWVHVFVFFVVLTNVFRSVEEWKPIIVTASVVAVLVAFIQLLSRFGIEIFPQQMSGASFGNSTVLGLYLLLSLPFLFSSLSVSKQTMQQILVGGGTCVVILALWLTPAIAVKLSFYWALVFLLGMGLFLFGKRHAQKIMGASLLILLFLGSLTAAILLFVQESSVREWFVAASSNGRFTVWGIAWQGFFERPWLGWGLEQFQYVFLRFYDSCLGSVSCGLETWFDKPHNRYLEILIEAGVVGLLAYLSIFFVTLLQFWKSVRARQTSTRLLVLILSSTLAAYLIQAFVGFDTFVTTFFLILLLGYGATVVGSDTPFVATHKEAVPSKAWFLLAIGITVSFPFAMYHFVILPITSHKALVSTLSSTTIEDHLATFEQATNGSPLGADLRRVYLAKEVDRITTNLTQEPSAREAAFIKQELALAVQALEETIQATPNDLRAYLRLGYLYQTEGRLFDAGKYEEAKRIYEEALALNPNNQKPYRALVGYFIERGEFAEAVTFLDTLIEMNPEVIQSHIDRIVAFRMMGDLMGLETALKQTQVFSPEVVEQVSEFLQIDEEALQQSKYRHLLLFY
ncbi:MAG: tetratricopeptide repeat protein [Candidatus Uhrbacteria bacterium]|nr:tetratricopeptide repeat protein [Candidatus Uhrbacteria bacterium]